MSAIGLDGARQTRKAVNGHLRKSGRPGGEQHPLRVTGWDPCNICLLDRRTASGHGQTEAMEKAWLPIADNCVNTGAFDNGREAFAGDVAGTDNEPSNDAIKFEKSERRYKLIVCRKKDRTACHFVKRRLNGRSGLQAGQQDIRVSASKKLPARAGGSCY